MRELCGINSTFKVNFILINKNNTSILVVDDERDICLMVSEILPDQDVTKSNN